MSNAATASLLVVVKQGSRKQEDGGPDLQRDGHYVRTKNPIQSRQGEMGERGRVEYNGTIRRGRLRVETMKGWLGWERWGLQRGKGLKLDPRSGLGLGIGCAEKTEEGEQGHRL